MTPSIIRRFARYHGINIGHVSVDQIGYIARKLHHPPSGKVGKDQARDAVVQALTRIEDAEMFQAARKTADAAGGYALTERMFALAGIDPERWEKVTE